MTSVRKYRNILSTLLILSCVDLAHSAGGTEQAANPDEKLKALYSDILEDYVYDGWKRGKSAQFVDYGSLESDSRWDELITLLANYPENTLNNPDKRKAFYINAYNILSINMVLEHWPLESLKDLGNVLQPVWTHNAGVVAGEEVTLRYLEHGVLRQTGDPRIHVAINCASMSCPDLRREPYVAADLDAQLNDQVRRFLSQENKGAIISEDGKTIHLSSIFGWFEEDFQSVGGVEAFVERHLPEVQNADDFIADIPYDWGINAEFSGAELAQLRDDF